MQSRRVFYRRFVLVYMATFEQNSNTADVLSSLQHQQVTLCRSPLLSWQSWSDPTHLWDQAWDRSQGLSWQSYNAFYPGIDPGISGQRLSHNRCGIDPRELSIGIRAGMWRITARITPFHTYCHTNLHLAGLPPPCQSPSCRPPAPYSMATLIGPHTSRHPSRASPPWLPPLPSSWD